MPTHEERRAGGVEPCIKVVIAVCDLTIPEDITATINRVLATWDCVHILANCAGVLCYGAFHRTSDERWRQTIAVNLLAPIQIVHQMLNTLLGADEAHILNVCSFVGLYRQKKCRSTKRVNTGLSGSPWVCAMTTIEKTSA